MEGKTERATAMTHKLWWVHAHAHTRTLSGKQYYFFFFLEIDIFISVLWYQLCIFYTVVLLAMLDGKQKENSKVAALWLSS